MFDTLPHDQFANFARSNKLCQHGFGASITHLLGDIEPSARGLGRSHPERLLHMFDRVEAPHKVLNPLLTGRYAVKALLRPGVDRRALLRDIVEELRIDASIWWEALRHRLSRSFRSARGTYDERPDWQWPPQRAGVEEKVAG